MPNKPLTIAHRGARSLAPENTIPAAQKAYNLGADMWELDCGMLADESLIVLHDDTFKRTTNISVVFPERASDHLSKFKLAEVRSLDAGEFFLKNDPFGQIAAGFVSQDEQNSFLATKIPTLEEALLFTRENNWQVNVEIKDMKHMQGDVKITSAVVKLIQSLNMQHNVLISSFNHHYLAQCKALDESIKTAALVGFQKPWDIANTVKLGCTAYHPPVYTLTNNQVKRALKKGLQVNVWTVNESDKMRSLVQAGATGIITDFPQRMHGIY